MLSSMFVRLLDWSEVYIINSCSFPSKNVELLYLIPKRKTLLLAKLVNVLVAVVAELPLSNIS